MKKLEIFHEDTDQPPAMLFLNGNIITEQDTLDAVDTILEKLNETDDLAPMDATLQSLLGVQKISGVALAKLLWGTKKWWTDRDMDRVTGDTFEDRMESMHRMKRIVVDRYISLWDKYEAGAIPEAIRARNMKDQIAISNAVEQGYEITKKIWRKLEDATNNSEVLKIIREDVKGQPPRKSSLQIFEERDGSLVAWDAEGRHVLGWLNSKEENDDPAIHKGLERIRNGSNLMRR
jgi:hypothetical protein